MITRSVIVAERRRGCVTLARVGQRRETLAVVGHVEWVQFAHAAHVPRAGEVVHAHNGFEEPAGGGAVAAVQLARLAGEAVLITALGEDRDGRRSVARLRELGVEVRASWRPRATRRAFTLVDDARERTITTIGPRLEPIGSDPEAEWNSLAGLDAVYFTAGDLEALRAARSASRVLVASPRARDALGHGVYLDALVLSGRDEIERHEAARAQADAGLVVLTDGAHGGSYRARSGEQGTWEAATAPGDPVDSYGCGDSFAAGLAYALGTGLSVPESLALAARCGAVCLTGSGPYERQLGAQDLKG
jgi:ribokinase